MDRFRLFRHLLIVIPVVGLPLGLWLQWRGDTLWADRAFAAVALPVLGALVWEIVASLRRGDVGLDIVAALSMSAALAFGENLAAAVVALMYAGGQYLEAYADGRAKREMTALLERAPRSAMRYETAGLRSVPIETIVAGDRLLVRQGDVVPVDGIVEGAALLDESSLTGESLPVRHRQGAAVMSGAANAGNAFDLVASKAAADSTYAGIVRLVAQAQESKAPMARLADRFALVFLGVTLAIAATAWLISGDPVRAVAVLVVATPCPLILAVPVAIAAGLSRAAAGGALVKGGKVLERLADIRTIVLDKTGTITHGEARLVSVETFNGWEEAELLRLAASLEQASQHVIARRIVREAVARDLSLSAPAQAHETPGEGVSGLVDGQSVTVGGAAFVDRAIEDDWPRSAAPMAAPGMVTVAIAIDGRPAGLLKLADGVRDGVGPLLNNLRAAGIGRIVLATGDTKAVADAVTEGLAIDAVQAGLSPEDKVAAIRAERQLAPTMMVGDGVNDAPALALADVGVAMGARGAAASAQAADMVLLVDRLDGVLTGLRAARRARSIALQSVYIGIGLSVAGMVAAAFGLLRPVQGALLQELIDVAAILNALRALRG